MCVECECVIEMIEGSVGGSVYHCGENKNNSTVLGEGDGVYMNLLPPHLV